MIDPNLSDLLDQIAGDIAARHAGSAENLSDIKDEFIAEVVRRFGDGTVTIPSREQIVADIYWRHVDARAKRRGQKVIRDWLRGQYRLCYKSDFALMVRVSRHRRTTLALYNADDLVAQAGESANNRQMVDMSDDEFQSQAGSGVAQLRQHGDLQGSHDARLFVFIDEAEQSA